MVHDVLFILWFFLPAGFANMAPIFAAKWPALARFAAPIDGGRSLGSKRILGDHKTWRGLVAGIVLGFLVFVIQQALARSFPAIQGVVGETYLMIPCYFGAVMGFGALLGDSIKSFFKRRVGVKSGKSWMPFDQIDYIIGAILVSLPFVSFTFMQGFGAILVWFLLHLLISFIGYLFKLKDEPI